MAGVPEAGASEIDEMLGSARHRKEAAAPVEGTAGEPVSPVQALPSVGGGAPG